MGRDQAVRAALFMFVSPALLASLLSVMEHQRPISTYSNQGCTKPGVNPSTHAVIHLEGFQPITLPNENLVLAPITMVPLYEGLFLHGLSRIEFARPNPIEHNQRIFPLGHVSKSSLRQLRDHYDKVAAFGDYPTL